MKIFIASDHGAVELRKEVFEYLKNSGYDVEDITGENTPTDDYPDFAHKVAQAVSNNPESRGILLCTSGIGVCIAANRHKRIRAGLVSKPEEAYFARKDDDINILCLAGKVIPKTGDKATESIEISSVREVLERFLNTPFNVTHEKYQRRLDKLDNY